MGALYAKLVTRNTLVTLSDACSLQRQKRIPTRFRVGWCAEDFSSYVFFVKRIDREPEHFIRKLAVKFSQEVLSPHIVALDNHDTEVSESPVFLAIVRVVIFGIAVELCAQGFEVLFAFLDLEEEGILAFWGLELE